MKESEAKKRHCWNMGRMCIGSKCMAWKWDRLHDHRERELWSKSKGCRVNSAATPDAEWRLKNPKARLPARDGTCGALIG